MHAMEIQQSWRVRLSFKNATILVTILNVMVVLFLLHGFLSSPSSSTYRNKLSLNQLSSGVSSFSLKNLSCFYLKKELKLSSGYWVVVQVMLKLLLNPVYFVFLLSGIFIFELMIIYWYVGCCRFWIVWVLNDYGYCFELNSICDR